MSFGWSPDLDLPRLKPGHSSISPCSPKGRFPSALISTFCLAMGTLETAFLVGTFPLFCLLQAQQSHITSRNLHWRLRTSCTNQDVPKLSWGSHTYAFKVIQIHFWGCDSLFDFCVSILLFLFNPPIVTEQLISTLGSEQGMLVHQGMLVQVC